MLFHHFKYTLKILLKNKMLVFWTFAFPIILGTLFNMAFKDIEKKEKLDIIDIAIVENKEVENNNIIKKAYQELGKKGSKDRVFNIKYVGEKKAKELLNKNKITGYIMIDNPPKVVISTNGINETVIKQVTEEILEQESLIRNIMKQKMKIQEKNGVSINATDLADSQVNPISIQKKEKLNIKDTTRSKLSYTMIEFYTLIAMACLYGGIIGMTAINQNLANMSSKGKRVSISPLSKFKLIVGSLLASYIIQLIGIILLFIFTIFILKIDYGNHLFLAILLSLIGSFSGLSLGVFTSTIFKTNENVKTGIIISITMLGCFLSGMMGITMKYIIDKNIPLLNKINPANMITDGFYSLYYYSTLDRFYFNMISLIVLSLILISISALSLRRQQYDSI